MSQPATTTRLAKPYRLALEHLRDAVENRAHSLTPFHREIITSYIDQLGGLLAMGFAPTEEVALELAREADAIKAIVTGDQVVEGAAA